MTLLCVPVDWVHADGRDVRMSAAGVLLVNLCVSLGLLSIAFIVSSLVGGSETACKAFSFFLHYFLLTSCVAMAIVVAFIEWTPFNGKKQKLVYQGTLLANWSMLMYLCRIKSLMWYISCAVFPIIIVAICIGADGDSYFNQEL